VLGASHQRSGLPNQDAIAWSPETGAGPPLVLAIADGHGSPKSFRSHRGSKLAVQVAIREIEKAFQLRSGANLPSITQAEPIAANLPQTIVQRWQQLVQAELQSDPIETSEWEHLQVKEGQTACGRVEQQPLLAYGTTLLFVFAADSFLLFFQLGDGDILCVNRDGQVSLPLVKDSRLIANETTSLCQHQAWKSVQWRLMPLKEPAIPELILLSTDGYANCFVSEADFQQIGPDYQQMLREQGLKQVMPQLPHILQQASQQGSGDDITLGLLLCQAETTTSQTRTAAPTKNQVKRPTRLTETVTVPVGSSVAAGSHRTTISGSTDVADSWQALEQQNQQQRQEIKRLKLWLNLFILTTIVSVLLAALSFIRQLQASSRQPQPTISASPSPTAGSRTTPAPTPTTSPAAANRPKPESSETRHASPNSTAEAEWLLQVTGQPSIPLKSGHRLISNPQQPGKILLEEKAILGILPWGQPCRDCQPLAEVRTDERGLLSIKNISGRPWQVTLPEQPRSLAEGDEIPLKAMQIDFGDKLKASIQSLPVSPSQPNRLNTSP
jgi:serine/threonine protein phosphatase PrpC